MKKNLLQGINSSKLYDVLYQEKKMHKCLFFFINKTKFSARLEQKQKPREKGCDFLGLI